MFATTWPRAATLAVLIVMECTEAEPVAPPEYFEGAVSQVFVTKDVFQNSETIDLKVVKSATDLCQQAYVKVTASTAISRVETPSTKEAPAAVKTAAVVRVIPVPTATTNCPTTVSATSIVIVK
jgi:hypothetical protein